MKDLLYKILLPIQYLLVFLFIVFEEFIWEGIAKPVAQYLASLGILQRLERLIAGVNRYVILVFFVLIFVAVELAGVTAGVLMVQGMFLPGLMIYALKIPIAAFTFWLFRVSREKLMSFAWFAWAYERLVYWIDRLKATKIYRRSLEIFGEIKIFLKKIKEELKELFFPESTGEGFVTRLKALYRKLKAEIRRNRL
ncbi:hypothetical protein [Nitratifractor salsuginis]|uniref:Bll5565 protein n=1 Tax=Nitratifractor salsuginis (strain DSM 16511 / JCM 12458 / E9I37-1) TaxID=749222 RepID=E6WZB8_NITSE|nr:hypothetical protein [Nitratifractor salsuginis]ADV46630.1 hypothetical protein Nitsa_1379 [Nitratifractor salsuginis DSM 16511]